MSPATIETLVPDFVVLSAWVGLHFNRFFGSAEVLLRGGYTVLFIPSFLGGVEEGREMEREGKGEWNVMCHFSA